MTEAEVTVAVVSWNTRDLLRRCLLSLAPEAERGRVTVWVVDNGSDDGSPELVEAAFGWATLLAPEGNVGFGAAVNLVAQRADSPWIAAANADVALRPGAIDAMLDAGRSPRVGAVAPRLVMPDGRTEHTVHPFPTLSLVLALNLGLPTVVPGLGERLALEGRWDPERKRVADWAHGALLLLRRSAFESVGGFDPGQWMYAEDLDLCWRLGRAGWQTVYTPAAMVDHAGGAATRQAFPEDRDRRHASAAYLWMARRRGAVVARAYAGLNLVGAIARWAALAPVSWLLPERFAARRVRFARIARLHALGLRSHRRLLAEADRARARTAALKGGRPGRR